MLKGLIPWLIVLVACVVGLQLTGCGDMTMEVYNVYTDTENDVDIETEREINVEAEATMEIERNVETDVNIEVEIDTNIDTDTETEGDEPEVVPEPTPEEEPPCVTERIFRDADGDGFGDPDYEVVCAGNPLPDGYIWWTENRDNDCDDANSHVNPIVVEFCDDIDNDCDGEIDEDCSLLVCEATAGTGECGAEEYCFDGVDNDCDGLIDETRGCTFVTSCARDADGDGRGTTDRSDCVWVVRAGRPECPEGYSASILGVDDCDDGNSDINPGAVELCDDIDNDCDSEIDEGCESETTTISGGGITVQLNDSWTVRESLYHDLFLQRNGAWVGSNWTSDSGAIDDTMAHLGASRNADACWSVDGRDMLACFFPSSVGSSDGFVEGDPIFVIRGGVPLRDGDEYVGLVIETYVNADHPEYVEEVMSIIDSVDVPLLP